MWLKALLWLKLNYFISKAYQNQTKLALNNRTCVIEYLESIRRSWQAEVNLNMIKNT